MSVDYSSLSTEKSNPRARRLEALSPEAALRLMDGEDARLLKALRKAAPALAKGIRLITRSLGEGGRLFFAGAGTSGRLGVLEAAECPPTFGTRPDQVQALMAGGPSSVFRSREGAEDRSDEAAEAVRKRIKRGDVLVGVAASGVTPFAKSALRAARRRGAATLFVTCNPSPGPVPADVVISVDTGPEVLAGSTRLKAGTATKIILNRLTTLSMVRLGKTFGPHMVDLQPRSKKLRARALRLVALLGKVDLSAAARLLRQAKGRAKTAILMARTGLDAAEAEIRLRRAGGFLHKLLAPRRWGGLLSLAVLLLGGIALPGRAAADPPVLTGLDVLEARGFRDLEGKRVGAIVNQTSVDRQGRSLVDLVRENKNVQLVCLFSPEHGVAGTVGHGEKIADSNAPGGIPVHSLYGATLRPKPEWLEGLDVLLFDVQDVGVRFYTYITTMGYALEAAKDAGIEFMVLDRPNPLGGESVEGERLDPSIRRFTGHYSLPVRHGLTVGEIARFHNRSVRHPRLTVVPMTGWRRKMMWNDTGLPFVGPSPNIKTPEAALLYAGIGSFEATNVSVGRGTPSPFLLLGAPWIDGKRLLERLRRADTPGLALTPARFTPSTDLYAGSECGGLRLEVTDAAAVRPVALFVRLAWALHDLSPDRFQPRWPEMPLVTGTKSFQTLMEAGRSANDYLKIAREDALRFRKDRASVLLYE